MKKITFFAISLVFASAISFWIGARFGAEQVQLASAAGDSIISTAYLGLIDRDEVEGLRNMLNSHLSDSISRYGFFLENDYSWFFANSPLFAEASTREGYMQKAVKYRLDNPYSIEWPKTIGGKPLTKEMSANIEEFEYYYQSALDRFSEDAHNKFGQQRHQNREAVSAPLP